MTDDIVTRLREAHGKALPDFYCNNLRFAACYEIERLRQELADWQRTVRALEAKAAKQGNIPEPTLKGENWQ